MTFTIDVSANIVNDATGNVDTFRYAMDSDKTYLEKNGEAYGSPVGDNLLCSLAHAVEGNELILNNVTAFCHKALSNIDGTVIAMCPDVDSAIKWLNAVLFEGEQTGGLAGVEGKLENITFDNGKYRYRAKSGHHDSRCLRYGEDWRDTSGDEAHYAFACSNQKAVLNQQILMNSLADLSEVVGDKKDHPDFLEVSPVYAAMIELQKMLKSPDKTGLYELGMAIEDKFNLNKKQQSHAVPVQP